MTVPSRLRKCLIDLIAHLRRDLQGKRVVKLTVVHVLSPIQTEATASAIPALVSVIGVGAVWKLLDDLTYLRYPSATPYSRLFETGLWFF